MDFFPKLFATDFMPHILCLRAAGIVWLHAISDGIIALAYFCIPLALVRVVHQRKAGFNPLYILFAIFIFGCGATHALAIVTLWIPIYRFEGLLKALTAIVSMLTAVVLLRAVPRIASLPSHEQWGQSTEDLKAEISRRTEAEQALLSVNADLGQRVEERIAELEEANRQLQELTAAWDLSRGFIRRLDGEITFWSQGSEQLYGWRKEEANGRSSHELLETVFPKPLAEIDRELREQGSWTGELIHTTKSGSHLTVATHWILRRGLSGDANSVIEVNNDLTDRLRAEETSQRLADLVESSNDAIIGSTLEGRITSWNSGAEKLLGYSAAEVIGQSVSLLTPAMIVASAVRSADSYSDAGSSAKHYETLRISKTGEEIPVSVIVSPIRNSVGEVIGTSHILHNISESKAQEEAFRLSEERQRLAVDAGQVGLWYLDVADGKCIWTQRCKELHGLNPDSEVPDYPAILSMVHPEDREALATAVRETLAGKADLLIEYRTRGVDFRTKWVQSRGQAQRDEKGKVKRLHGTLIDLTARKEMEDKLRRANTELEQFAYAAAHDLQEPLRNVALAAALLKIERSDIIPAGDPPLLSTIIDDARRMEAMVKDLLAYSRALDVADERDTSTDGAKALQKVLQNLSAAISDKQAEITNDPIPFISMHEAHLVQILQNLIGNALKYNEEVFPVIHIGAVVRPGDVLLSVRDNGIGIAPQFHSRAFGMFKRLHSGGVKGTGIGLAVCKRIVEHYGGKIWIESEVGEGATFLFSIPATDHQ